MCYPTKIEDFTTDQLDSLEESLKTALEYFHIQYKGLIIVGSVCFGREKINDIDIIIIAKDYLDINQKAQIRRELTSKSGMFYDIFFIPEWNPHWQRSDLGLLVPYYDLTNRILFNKHPGDYIPFNFCRPHNQSSDNPYLITYNLRKNTQIKSYLKAL